MISKSDLTKFTFSEKSTQPPQIPSSPSLDRVCNMTPADHDLLAQLNVHTLHYDVRSEILDCFEKEKDKALLLELLKKYIPYDYEDESYANLLIEAAKLFSSFEPSHRDAFVNVCGLFIPEEAPSQTCIVILRILNKQFATEKDLNTLISDLQKIYHEEGIQGLETHLRNCFFVDTDDDTIDLTQIPIDFMVKSIVALIIVQL